MIVKTSEDIERLRTGGALLAQALKATAALVSAGQSTAALDLFAEKYIRDGGGIPSFLGYKPQGARTPFPAVLCVSINNEVVHGIPSETRILQEGDIVSLDLGLSYQGIFVDSALTLCVGECDTEARKLITATQEAIQKSIAACHVGGHIGDIGAAIKEVADKYHFSAVEDLGGHAVGGAVHEQPFIPNEGIAGEGEKIPEGMVLAIEPMLAEGKGAIRVLSDGWTCSTRDHSRAAHFEHTVLVGKKGCEIVTV